MIFLEANYAGIVYLFLAIMLGPPILLASIGIAYYKKKPNLSKILFILAVLYLLIGGGICGSLLMS